jgi:hypothetical protein
MSHYCVAVITDNPEGAVEILGVLDKDEQV